jgi:hypothetical protein
MKELYFVSYHCFFFTSILVKSSCLEFQINEFLALTDLTARYRLYFPNDIV